MAEIVGDIKASDILLRAKDSDKTERIIFPITRYENILTAPKMTTQVSTSFGAPFLLLKQSSVLVDEDELYELCAIN